MGNSSSDETRSELQDRLARDGQRPPQPISCCASSFAKTSADFLTPARNACLDCLETEAASRTDPVKEFAFSQNDEGEPTAFVAPIACSAAIAPYERPAPR